MTGHTLILGMSQSGKSTLAKIMACESIKRGRTVVVLDPIYDAEWSRIGCVVFYSTEKFNRYIKDPDNREMTVIVDEVGLAIARNKAMNHITTSARHRGHVTIVIGHERTDLSPVMRNNCGTLCLFVLSRESREMLAREWDCDAILSVKLNQGEFLYIQKFKGIKMGRIDFKKRTLSLSEIK